MKKAKLSTKDTVLLVVLVVLLIAAAYYMFYLTPLQNKISSAKLQSETIEAEIANSSVRVNEMKKMQAELDEIFAQPTDKITEIAPYDNAKVIMNDLNRILGQSLNYDISFAAPSFSSDGMVRRSVKMGFTAETYEAAQQIVRQLCSSKWRCLMTALTIDGEEDITESDISATANIVFFESKNIA